MRIKVRCDCQTALKPLVATYKVATQVNRRTCPFCGKVWVLVTTPVAKGRGYLTLATGKAPGGAQ